MAALIVPGNLIVKNGGCINHTGDLSVGNDDIYKKGSDMIVDGVILSVDGDIKVGGDQITES